MSDERKGSRLADVKLAVRSDDDTVFFLLVPRDWDEKDMESAMMICTLDAPFAKFRDGAVMEIAEALQKTVGELLETLTGCTVRGTQVFSRGHERN